jgi:hypothetical protein
MVWAVDLPSRLLLEPKVLTLVRTFKPEAARGNPDGPNEHIKPA